MIRSATPQDTAAVIAIRAKVFPYQIRSAAAFQRMMELRPPQEQSRHWVSHTESGEVTGYASAGLNVNTTEARAGRLSLFIDPGHQRLGIGTSLLAPAMAHLREIGAHRVRVFAAPQGLEFARRHGYEASRELRFSALDPRELPEMPAVPSGVALVPLGQLTPQDVHAADVAASVGEPGDMPGMSEDYENWVRDIWGNPDLDKEMSLAVLVEGRIATLVALEVVGERAWSGFTGTVPEFRGRGLAKLGKSAALRLAVKSGVTVAYTSNDAENGPMLAVNTWLGYQPVGTQWACLTTLG